MRNQRLFILKFPEMHLLVQEPAGSSMLPLVTQQSSGVLENTFQNT